jgi:arabinan endo-1,5-alpha-L-arabinosidase
MSLVLFLAPWGARAMETNVLVRDPSTIVKRGGAYWVYGTGAGVREFSSKDRIHWTKQGQVFPTAPGWVAQDVPGNKDNVSWAPDIHLLQGKYFLYYSYSSWGSHLSGIGVATSANLDPRSWVDQGVVIHSTQKDDFNTIDPCIMEDVNGGVWLSFGSYFSGVKMIRIDPQTGKQSADDPKIYDLANDGGHPGNAIEASCVYYHDGYYYLFVNWGGCCAGSRSTYNIRIGRSKSVTGPYLDKAGKEMLAGGGTLFLSSVYDKGAGAPFDDEVGPGHAAILHDGKDYYFSYHEEWARDKHGATTLNINRLAWDTDGWPRMVLDPGPYKMVSAISTHDVLQVVGGLKQTGAFVETWPYEGLGSQKWTLAHQGDGYYSITGVGSHKCLAAAGGKASAGAHVDIEPFKNLDFQLWYLQQNEDGTYFLFNKNGNKSTALDVGGCSEYDGTPVGLWTGNGMVCQGWSFRVW